MRKVPKTWSISVDRVWARNWAGRFSLSHLSRLYKSRIGQGGENWSHRSYTMGTTIKVTVKENESRSRNRTKPVPPAAFMSASQHYWMVIILIVRILMDDTYIQRAIWPGSRPLLPWCKRQWRWRTSKIKPLDFPTLRLTIQLTVAECRIMCDLWSDGCRSPSQHVIEEPGYIHQWSEDDLDEPATYFFIVILISEWIFHIDSTLIRSFENIAV